MVTNCLGNNGWVFLEKKNRKSSYQRTKQSARQNKQFLLLFLLVRRGKDFLAAVLSPVGKSPQASGLSQRTKQDEALGKEDAFGEAEHILSVSVNNRDRIKTCFCRQMSGEKEKAG